MPRFSISRESRILLLICVFDLISTVWLVTTGHAVEGNPVMAFYLNKGLPALVMAKIVLSILPVLVLEWCRRYRPHLVYNALRIAIAAYVGMYVVVFIGANVFPLGHAAISNVRTDTEMRRLMMQAGEPTSPASKTSSFRQEARIEHFTD